MKYHLFLFVRQNTRIMVYLEWLICFLLHIIYFCSPNFCKRRKAWYNLCFISTSLNYGCWNYNSKKLKIPCICEVRDLWPEAIFAVGKAKESSLLGKLLVAGEHWIYKKADALVFLKEGDTNYLKERKWTQEQGGDIDFKKCYYINNGVDIEVFNKEIEEKSTWR